MHVFPVSVKGVVVRDHEHGQVGLFTPAELAALPMPQGYRDSVATWFARLN